MVNCEYLDYEMLIHLEFLFLYVQTHNEGKLLFIFWLLEDFLLDPILVK